MAHGPYLVFFKCLRIEVLSLPTLTDCDFYSRFHCGSNAMAAV